MDLRLSDVTFSIIFSGHMLTAGLHRAAMFKPSMASTGISKHLILYLKLA